MGGTTSKSEIAIQQLNEIVANVAVKNTTKCASTVTQRASNRVVNAGWSFGAKHTVRQKATIDSQCMTKTEVINDVVSDIIAELEATATSNKESVLGDILRLSSTNTESSILHDLSNQIRSSMTTESITESINAVDQMSDMEYINYGIDIFGSTSVENEADVTAVVLVDVLAKGGVYNTIATVAETYTSLEETTMYGNMTYYAVAAVAFIVIAIIIAIVVSTTSSGRSSQPSMPYHPPQYQPFYPPYQQPQPQYQPL